MANNDPKLGQQVHKYLLGLGIENPVDFEQYSRCRLSELQEGFSLAHKAMGLSTGHPSTVETPRRLAKMYREELTSGLEYEFFPQATTSPNDGSTKEIILVRNIEIKSLCEHHWQPVIGRAHIAYIPAGNLLGLSKFNRIAQFFARRPQLQERMCEQILATMCLILGTDDVAVIVEAEHFCVKFRGVEDLCSDTVTSRMSGKFMEVPSARAELLQLIQMGK